MEKRQLQAKKMLGPEPTVHETASLRDARLGRYTEVGARTSLIETALDDYSYIVNDGDVIYTEIGKFCSIAAFVRINPGNHPTWRATQAHFTYRASRYFDDAEDEAEFFQWRREHKVAIGHDVWIGHGATVMPGVTIGTGAVIGAGAIVTRDVEPYWIAVGTPARPIRRRHDEKVAEGLMRIAWWDWSHERLRSALDDFRGLSAEAFVEKYG